MLAQPQAACRSHGATLLIAGLDRLSRNAHFLRGPPKAGVEFIAADMPGANNMMLGIMAVIAQLEHEQISARTRAALAAAEARYTKLGNPGRLARKFTPVGRVQDGGAP